MSSTYGGFKHHLLVAIVERVSLWDDVDTLDIAELIAIRRRASLRGFAAAASMKKGCHGTHGRLKPFSK